MLNQHGAQSSEAARKAAAKSYKTVGRKEHQAEMFPKLEAEIAKTRAELYSGLRYPGPAARRTPEFLEALSKECSGRVGGTPEQQREFYDKVICKFIDCFWIEGCDVPRVRNPKIPQLIEGSEEVGSENVFLFLRK